MILHELESCLSLMQICQVDRLIAGSHNTKQHTYHWQQLSAYITAGIKLLPVTGRVVETRMLVIIFV